MVVAYTSVGFLGTIEELDGLIVPVESLVITDKSVVMNENEAYQLPALISPENATYKTLLWQSSDEDIATVDEDSTVTSYGNLNVFGGVGLKNLSFRTLFFVLRWWRF